MKKRFQLLAIVLVLVLAFSACAKTVEEQTPVANEPEVSTDTTETAPTEEPVEVLEPGSIVMKIGHAQSTSSARHISLLMFENLVEQKTNGVVDVQIFPSAQLGNEQELIEQVKLGTLQGARAGQFDLVTKELSIYMMPFLFDNVESFQQITRGPIGDKIAATANEVGIEIIATGDAGGFRQWTNNVRPIKTPEDMAGLKMRTPGVQTIIDSMTAFGANVVSIPYVEVYQALKTGVADGEENPYVNIVDMKFYEVQKYLTVADYQVHPDPFYVNKEWLESLPADIEAAIRESGKEMMVVSDQLYTDWADTARATIEAAGVEIYELTADEKALFIDAAQPVYDKYISEGLIDEELFNEVLEALGRK